MYVNGVGPTKKQILNKELGIMTFGDMLEYYPYKYVDRSHVYTISSLTQDMSFVQIKGRILSFETFQTGVKKKRLVAHFGDGTGVVDLVWFSGTQYITKNFKVGIDYIVFGKPTVFGGRFQFTHPEIEKAENLQLSQMGMQPYYVTTEKMKNSGLTSRSMEKIAKAILTKMPELSETLPDYITTPLHLVSRDTAVRNVHYPKSQQDMQKARERLKFEELFYVQLNILRYTANHRRKYKGYMLPRIGEHFREFFSKNLKFELTGAQKRVMHEIQADMNTGRQMNRLVQGDVGSGKTLVALMAMLIAVDNGFQACIMAPTEILAEQHLATVQEFLRGLDVKVELLTGIVKGKKRKEVLEQLVTGEIDILVGTHALIEETVLFKNLGLAVVDEQHRFGVNERNKLQKKGDKVNVLVMSATPIPRTLSLLLYADLSISKLTDKPVGRLPIKNAVITEKDREKGYKAIKKELDLGHQAYVICPSIEGSDEEGSFANFQNVVDYTKKLKEFFGKSVRVEMLHGKMKNDEKNEIMQDFKNGNIDILCSTTVIEVGVDVKNATFIMIEDAGNFGLATLHQLRGRVGRGEAQSFALFVDTIGTEKSKERLSVLEKSNDGFFIAEKDLEMRGPGDIFGVKQAGEMEFKLGDIYTDMEVFKNAAFYAKEVIKNDTNLSKKENYLIKCQLDEYVKNSYTI